MSPFVDRHRDEILRVAEEHGALRVRVFGSLARGEGSEGSDLDLLVGLEEGRSDDPKGAKAAKLQPLEERPDHAPSLSIVTRRKRSCHDAHAR